MFDGAGNLTRTWLLFFQGLTAGSTSTTASALPGYYVVPIAAGLASPDISQGWNQEVILTTNVAIDDPANVPGSLTWTLMIAQDSTGGRVVTFGTTYIGVDPASFRTDADTYTSIDFLLLPDGTSRLKNIVTGVPLS
jgi:hypothetical protein